MPEGRENDVEVVRADIACHPEEGLQVLVFHFLSKVLTTSGCADEDPAAVCRVRVALNQAALQEAIDNAGGGAGCE
jgi:hypothetical protein